MRCRQVRGLYRRLNLTNPIAHEVGYPSPVICNCLTEEEAGCRSRSVALQAAGQVRLLTHMRYSFGLPSIAAIYVYAVDKV